MSLCHSVEKNMSLCLSVEKNIVSLSLCRKKYVSMSLCRNLNAARRVPTCKWRFPCLFRVHPLRLFSPPLGRGLGVGPNKTGGRPLAVAPPS